ncbi:hypothetical protein ACFZAV_39140 [Streptomyces sp. NPDC008343]|uniref:hypothetical protein n=1 Tax=Streptomyces sp. NPDC008343 TaxID=3364828 RepID=UPI0036E625D3
MSQGHGKALLTRGFDLRWASAWMDVANQWISRGPSRGRPGYASWEVGMQQGITEIMKDGDEWASIPIIIAEV